MRLEVHSPQRTPRLEHHHGLHALLAVLPHVKLRILHDCIRIQIVPGPEGMSGYSPHALLQKCPIMPEYVYQPNHNWPCKAGGLFWSGADSVDM